jgi:hypothetical protein
MPLKQDDGNGHSVNVTTMIATNFAMPEQISPNGQSQLATNALYNTPSISPTSVAPPYQSVYDSAYTSGTAFTRITTPIAG